MECPICHKENDTSSRFCIYCGSLLETPGSGAPIEPLPDSDGTIGPLIQQLQGEVHRLKELFLRMDDRLYKLERSLGVTIPSHEPAPEPKPVPPTQITVEPKEALEAPAPVSSAEWQLPAGPSVEHWPSADESPVQPAALRPSTRRDKGTPAKPREWEQILGGNWLARIGVIALIIGAAFFIKFAFDNNWLGPAARVILGAVAGLIVVGAGYYWRKKYPIFAQALCGGGIALLYISIFAAGNIYSLVSFYPAVGLLLLVSIGSSALAIRFNSMALAIIGISGAFLAPFILGASGADGNTQTSQGVGLLAYIMVVDLGVLALSTFRNWRWFTLLAFFGSLLAYTLWYSDFNNTASLLTEQLSLTILFLIFVGATSLFHIIWRREVKGSDYILMVINAAAYLGISYGLMWGELREWLGGFTLLIAFLYGGLAYVTFKRGVENTRLSHFALGIAFIFLTIAIPVQLGDKAWTTIALAAEGGVLMWLSLKQRINYFRVYGYIAFAIVAVRLLIFDTTINIRLWQPIFNERFLAFIMSIAAMYLTSYVLWRYREDIAKFHHPLFLIAANLFTLWIIAAEVISYRDTTITLQGSLSLIVLVTLAGLMTLYHFVWRRVPQVFDLILVPINAAAYFGVSALLWEDLRPWMGSLYFVLFIIYGLLAYVTLKRNTDSSRFGFIATGIALVFFTVAVPVQFRDTAWTTAIWAAEVVMLMWLSFAMRVPQFRYYCYAVFVILAGRLLIFDTTIDLQPFQPVLNERFLAFTAGIAAAYLCAYLLWRRRKTLPEWDIPTSTFLVAANLFSLWLLSFEAWDYFGSHKIIANENAQIISLTAVWAIYAVIGLVVGIIKRWRPVRLWALGLLAVPIAKLFIYDVWVLERVYRIAAFIGLGLLLIASGYLYNRYSRAIREFLVNK